MASTLQASRGSSGHVAERSIERRGPVADVFTMTDPRGIEVRRTAAGEQWRHAGRSRALAAGHLLAAALFALIAAAARSTPAPFADDVAVACVVLAVVSVVLALRVLDSGLSLDADGVTGRGIVVSRRLRWDDVARFYGGVEELTPNKPAAVVHARLRGGRVVTLPGTRVEGWKWNLDRHRRIVAGVASALDERRRMSANERSIHPVGRSR
jgi:hypothetical protein